MIVCFRCLQDSDERTPLIAAAEFGFANLVKPLLVAGADPHLTGDSENALTMALEFNHREIARLLVTEGKYDHKETLQIVPEQVNWHKAVDSEEELQPVSPLVAAVAKGWTDVAEALLANGADPQLKQEQGPTALELVENEAHEWGLPPPPEFDRQALKDLMRRSGET